MHDGRGSLVVREDELVSDNNILPPSRGKDNGLGDIVRRQRLAARINRIRRLLITIEPHNREVRLDLTRIDANDTDTLSNQLFLKLSVNEWMAAFVAQ